MLFSLRLTSLVLLLSLCASSLHAQHEAAPLQNAFLRPHQSLNGDWNYFLDRYESFFYDFVRVPFDSVGGSRGDFAALDKKPVDRTDRLEYSFDNAPVLNVPGDWNSQVERLLYYEGSVWYRQLFNAPTRSANQTVLLRFGAANYRADVYVNGQKAGMHEGGFTPFAFDVTSLLRDGENSLVVRIDNQRHRDAVPTDVTDWWNYGGVTRDVNLYVVPDNYISDYQLQLSSSDSLAGFVQLHGKSIAGQNVRVQQADLGIDLLLKTDADGRAGFAERVTQKIRYWSPDDPHRYTFSIEGAKDKTVDKIGLRTVTTRGTQILLNGKPVFLSGICSHEENPLRGARANGYDDAALLMGWAKELNANFMRLAHYPHNEYMPRLADSIGMLLWEEIPVYWTIDWENPVTYDRAQQQLTELVTRDRNRASVIIWSMANETPNTDARLTFLKKLAAHARQMDGTRLISAASFKENVGPQRYEVTDPFAEFADIISFNEYIGWYEGTPALLPGAKFTFRQNKPVLISEFGAGAKANFHGDSLTRWSEEYQDWLYRETLNLIDRTPEIAGFTPWILADFRSPRRQLHGIQDGWNRKGVISQQGKRKLAFHRLRKYYEARQADLKD
ncbi:MAG: glycoside hydrolase family 2 protein [Saprospiraceae bacterium]